MAKKQRNSTKRKAELVLRLLRGESIELVSRECVVPVYELEGWRKQFLNGGENSFKKKPEFANKLAEYERVIGRMKMENELLKKKENFRR